MNALIPYLKRLGFKRKNVVFIPVSGLDGVNLVKQDKEKLPWFDGPSLIDFVSLSFLWCAMNRFGTTCTV